ncbi:MAG TPA: hypothetical protein VGP15_03075 [Burkholderiales bacterium]|nr:hypothetical protein [Burkholderiales bacterium]
MRLSAAILMLLLAACASTPTGDVPSARSSWQGATYDEVVASWGTPVRSTKMSDGRDVYTWVSESVTGSRSAAFFPSLGIFGGNGGVGFGTGVTMAPGGGGSELVRCERTLIFQNGRVAEQTWQGPPDYCTSFRR